MTTTSLVARATMALLVALVAVTVAEAHRDGLVARLVLKGDDLSQMRTDVESLKEFRVNLQNQLTDLTNRLAKAKGTIDKPNTFLETRARVSEETVPMVSDSLQSLRTDVDGLKEFQVSATARLTKLRTEVSGVQGKMAHATRIQDRMLAAQGDERVMIGPDIALLAVRSRVRDEPGAEPTQMAAQSDMLHGLQTDIDQLKEFRVVSQQDVSDIRNQIARMQPKLGQIARMPMKVGNEGDEKLLAPPEDPSVKWAGTV